MQLIEFQKNNVKALVQMLGNNQRVLLADETGLGKTLTTVLLIAGLAVRKYNTLRNKSERSGNKFKVLYICSNERIARKNMRELCLELSDDKSNMIQEAAKLIQCTYKCDSVLLSKEDARKMAAKRDARLSLELTKYDSFIQIYNATPETSFRVSNSIKVGGTDEEFKKLMGYDKPTGINLEDNDDIIKAFAEKRREAVVDNFVQNKFDLIVLDEYQSYEDILPVNGKPIKKDGMRGTTVSELLERITDTKVLMLSATPYQSQTKEPDKFEDFRGILSFLSCGNDTALVKNFDKYNGALADTNCSFQSLTDAKNAFEEKFQKYCRRNQRSDAFSVNNQNKDLFAVPVIKKQTEFLGALYEEALTRKEASDIRNSAKNSASTGINTATDELSNHVLEIQMERDTAWGYSFSKDYAFRKEKNNRELYGKLAGHDNLLIKTGTEPEEGSCSKRCDQSMLDAAEEIKQSETSGNETLDCKRLFEPGEPRELCNAKKWPNFKLQAIREIATETENKEDFPKLYDCIWLPPSAPDYEPDENSPYHKFYQKNPSKTIIFSHYKMTTRSIAALISVEASKGGKKLPFQEDDWDKLCKVPDGADAAKEDVQKGHPFCCAYNALGNFIEKEGEKLFFAQKIAKELVAYLKKPEIQAVLARVGVENAADLMSYCKNGNLTAVLREYLSIKKIDFSHNEILLYASSKYSDWDKLKPFERLERVYRLAWEEMKAANPDEILDDILTNGFKDEYVDDRKEPYDGLIDGKADGFETIRIAAWKTWFAYQVLYGEKALDIQKQLRLTVSRAIERMSVNPNNGINQKAFNSKWYKEYKNYEVFGKPIAANTKESCIMKRFYADSLTFDGDNKAPNRYINSWYANAAECDEPDVEKFFEQGVADRIKEKKRDVRKSYLSTHHVLANQTCPMKACHTELFSSATNDVWDGVDNIQNEKILDFMPEMHVCADYKLENAVRCGRIRLGFSSRYTNEIQDSNDHNDNGAEEVMKAFNSPFYPFVLAVTDTAKEGLNFHTYCRRLIHLNIPDRPAVLIQREGRVDRFRSLVLRQRLARLISNPVSDWEAAWKSVSTNMNGMVPNWYIDMDEGPKIEKYYLVNEGTDDWLKVGDIEREAELFKRMLGSFLEENLVEQLRQRYPTENITGLKLNLIP